MNSGALRHRVTIQAQTAAQDRYGENLPTWADVATVWASVSQLTERQISEAQARMTTTTATHEIRMRYRPGLSVTNRLVYAGRCFAINRIDDVDGRHRELTIIATEAV